MQTYPARYAIEAPFYRFTGFDKAAVEAVLAQLLPQRLHLWETDQAQSVGEGPEFYDGQYSVEPLTLPDAEALTVAAEGYARWLSPRKIACCLEAFALAKIDSEPRQVFGRAWLERLATR